MSPAARALIRRHVRSVGELDLLVLLHAERERSWSAEEICAELGCPPGWAATQLSAMERAGLVQRDGDRWRFAVATTALEQVTEEISEAYRLHARELVRFVFATAGRSDKHARRRSA